MPIWACTSHNWKTLIHPVYMVKAKFKMPLLTCHGVLKTSQNTILKLKKTETAIKFESNWKEFKVFSA